MLMRLFSGLLLCLAKASLAATPISLRPNLDMEGISSSVSTDDVGQASKSQWLHDGKLLMPRPESFGACDGCDDYETMDMDFSDPIPLPVDPEASKPDDEMPQETSHLQMLNPPEAHVPPTKAQITIQTQESQPEASLAERIEDCKMRLKDSLANLPVDENQVADIQLELVALEAAGSLSSSPLPAAGSLGRSSSPEIVNPQDPQPFHTAFRKGQELRPKSPAELRPSTVPPNQPPTQKNDREVASGQ